MDRRVSKTRPWGLKGRRLTILNRTVPDTEGPTDYKAYGVMDTHRMVIDVEIRQ